MNARRLFPVFLVAQFAAAAAGAARGGPDLGGYEWSDGRQGLADLPIPPAVGDQQLVPVTDESLSPVLDLGIAFPFYGSTFTRFRASDNGWMSFDLTDSAPLPEPRRIPASATLAPPFLIAPFWRDLVPLPPPTPAFWYQRVEGGVRFHYVAYVKGTARLVDLDWVLYESGLIRIWYNRVARADTAGVGFQGDGTPGLGLMPWFTGEADGGFELATDSRLLLLPPAALRCDQVPTLPCQGQAAGSSPAIGQASSYLCSATPHNGHESVFKFANRETSNVTFTIGGFAPAGIDLDIFVLEEKSCSEFRCLAGGEDQVTLPLLPEGDYFVVVDGKAASDNGSFRLSASCEPRSSGIACADSVSGVTGGASVWQSYPCAPVPLTGPEYLYEVSFTPPGILAASLANHPGGDLDLLVFDATRLQPAACLAHGDERVELFDPPAGRYVFLVEGRDGYAGSFDLSVSCDRRLECSSPSGELLCEAPLRGSTAGAPARVAGYSCPGEPLAGPEAVHRFVQAADGPVGFTIDGPPDLRLELLGAGCSEAGCIAAGRSLWVPSLAAGTYWLVVDGDQPEGAEYELTAICRHRLAPESLDVILTRGECARETKTAFAGGSAERVDVLLLVDLTSTQSETLRNLPLTASAFLDELASGGADVSFAVGSFADYPGAHPGCGYSSSYGVPGDFPWRLDLAMTSERDRLADTLAALALQQGGDLPEPYARAWFEAYSDPAIGWRSCGRRVAIMTGDDVPHDCQVGACLGLRKASRGTDPGRDGAVGGGDDLAFLDVLPRVSAAGILPVFLFTHVGSRPVMDDLRLDEILALWECWMGLAGGLAFDAPLGVPPAAAPALVLARLEERAKACTSLGLHASAGYESWLMSDPAEVADFALPGKTSFEISLCPPDGAEGTHEFTVDLVCDECILASQSVRIRTGPCVADAQASVEPATACAGALRRVDGSSSTIAGCPGAVEYEWRDRTGSVLAPWSAAGAELQVTPEESTTYTLAVRCADGGECTATAEHSVEVAVTAAPGVDAGPDAVTCRGYPVVLGSRVSQPSLLHSWSPTDYLNDPGASDPRATPVEVPAGGWLDYRLTTRDLITGCSAADDVRLWVVAGPAEGTIGNHLRLTRQGGEVRLDWSDGPLLPAAYNLHRTSDPRAMQPPLAAPIAAVVAGQESWVDEAASGASLLYYAVYGRDCAGASIYP